MQKTLINPYRGTGLDLGAQRPEEDATNVSALLAQCPAHQPTPLVSAPKLAALVGVSGVAIKDESGRMGLGSFKALGAAHVIARDAAEIAQVPGNTTLSDRTYVAASAGNHGLSVAAGARVFGASAVIYLADTVPEAFADRLRRKGAQVVRAGATYEDSMAAAMHAATEKGWTLLSDSTWDGYIDPAVSVMEGYLQMIAEVVSAIEAPPTHIFLQAGVGGMAAAVAAGARKAWGDAPKIVVVEPAAAPALQASISAGALVTAEGPVSDMGRLDCKTPSLVGLVGLSKDADMFVTVSEDEAHAAVATLAAHGFHTTPSGGAGLAAVLAQRPELGPSARLLAFLSEGPEDA